MKKLFIISTICCLFFTAKPASATGILYFNFNAITHQLWVEASEFLTWGCHDEERIEWDRFVTSPDDKMPRIYLIGYGIGETRLAVYQLPVSKGMLIYGKLDGVVSWTHIQLKALVWKGDKQEWVFWAIDKNHPIMADFNSVGVEKVETPEGWVFRAIRHCPCP
ncbi:MAG: hypothetical protein WC678_04395 [Parcubacteria group bacterium]|jgi:hypothetical protein